MEIKLRDSESEVLLSPPTGASGSGKKLAVLYASSRRNSGLEVSTGSSALGQPNLTHCSKRFQDTLTSFGATSLFSTPLVFHGTLQLAIRKINASCLC